MPAPDTGPPSTIVFEVDTARRVGAQLRYGGGRSLDEIRVAIQLLTGGHGGKPSPISPCPTPPGQTASGAAPSSSGPR